MTVLFPPPYRPALATIILLSASVNLTTLDNSYKWNHVVLAFCNKLLHLYNVLKIHPFCSIWQYFFFLMLKNILLAYTIFCLSIHLCQTGFHLHDCKILLLQILVYKHLRPCFQFFDIYQELGLLDHKVVLFLIFKETPYCFHSGWTTIHYHQQHKGSNFSTALPEQLFFVCLSYSSHPTM